MDIITEARRRDTEALQRIAALRAYFEARRNGKSVPVPSRAQQVTTEHPAKLPRRVARLSIIEAARRIWRAPVVKPKENEICRILYPQK